MPLRHRGNWEWIRMRILQWGERKIKERLSGRQNIAISVAFKFVQIAGNQEIHSSTSEKYETGSY